jgi:shikimate kinase
MNVVHRPVFFIGMMGAGKSHWARQLAAHFSVLFFDTDHMIEKKASKTIADIFKEDGGEERFRNYEKQLMEEMQWPERCFVSCGGGFPCFHDNMNKLLQAGRVVWLNPDVEELVNRIWYEKQKRPLVAESESREELRARVIKILGQREETYRKAHITLDLPVPTLQDLLNALKT